VQGEEEDGKGRESEETVEGFPRLLTRATLPDTRSLATEGTAESERERGAYSGDEAAPQRE